MRIFEKILLATIIYFPPKPKNLMRDQPTWPLQHCNGDEPFEEKTMGLYDSKSTNPLFAKTSSLLDLKKEVLVHTVMHTLSCNQVWWSPLVLLIDGCYAPLRGTLQHFTEYIYLEWIMFPKKGRWIILLCIFYFQGWIVTGRVNFLLSRWNHIGYVKFNWS